MPNTDDKANKQQAGACTASLELPDASSPDSSAEGFLESDEIGALRAFFELLAQWDEEDNRNGNRNSH